MEGDVSSFESAKCEPPVRCELLILHTAEAQEWATYLQKILKSSRKFPKRSILLYTVGPAEHRLGYNFDHFHSSKCIVLLLTGAFLDLLSDPELQGALERLLHPPQRVVALLCGVSEDDMPTRNFEHWSSWRKLYAEDEPAVYISTILESFSDSRREKAEHKREAPAATELEVPVVTLAENPIAAETEEDELVGEEKETVLKDIDDLYQDMSALKHLACLTVQPNRVLCGDRVTIFIIFTHKVDNQSKVEVEFSCESVAAKRVPGTLENEYTISVSSPDMPSGVVSLTMHTDQSSVRLKPVTYYTSMGEVSRYLESSTAPMDFICQAFNITSNSTESLDNMLTDSFKSRMPATGFQVFGIRQIEEDNMAAYQRNEELPTLLHFAAKYGLKKLTTVLLQCPGALQAYSVMNKYGDYPNKLAENSGFLDLRQFMDDFVETADMLKTHIKDSITTEEDGEVYEMMSVQSSQDIIIKYSSCSEDIYESMLVIDPECADDLYEAMNAVEDHQNTEEAMLRMFFQAKPDAGIAQDDEEHQNTKEETKDEQDDPHRNEEEEEDPYNLCPEDIYDTVDGNTCYASEIFNRPPAPIPRPEASQAEESKTYISRVFSEKVEVKPLSKPSGSGLHGARPVVDLSTSPVYDPYAGMKTPGQRQLIALQERVKVGAISVDEAVQEFKAWQFDHERRSNSLRYQQENLKKLRDSITRRHKARAKTGKEIDLEITAPLQRNQRWGSDVTEECAVYESTTRAVAPPPPVARSIQRGSWKTGSTSSTSSTESNRLSTHSTISYSSGTEPDFEDTLDGPPAPPRPPRSSDGVPLVPPPRIPPRIPERVPENMLQERYISCPTRALPQRPTSTHRTSSPPPIPRRMR